METLNRNALVAWFYIWETVAECPADKVDKGYEFRRLLCDLMDAYPNEYEAVSAFHDVQVLLAEFKGNKNGNHNH